MTIPLSSSSSLLSAFVSVTPLLPVATRAPLVWKLVVARRTRYEPAAMFANV